MKEHKSTNEQLGFLNTSNSGQTIHAIQHLEKKVSGEKTGLQKNDSNDKSLGWDGFHEILWSNSPHKVRLTWTLYHTGPCPKSASNYPRPRALHHFRATCGNTTFPLSPAKVFLEETCLSFCCSPPGKVPMVFVYKFKRNAVKCVIKICIFPCYHSYSTIVYCIHTSIYKPQLFEKLQLIFPSKILLFLESFPALAFHSFHTLSFLWKAAGEEILSPIQDKLKILK